jgi:uncharacterized protein YlxW (UPF0749 family)
MPDDPRPEPVEGPEATGPEPVEGPEATGPDPVEGPSSEQPGGPLRRPLRRPGRGQILAAAILFLVGLAVVVQVRANRTDDGFGTARRGDLIVLLDGLGQQSRRLDSEISDLERARSQLQSGANSRRIAQAEARKRLDDLSILAGTAPAVGPGIRIRIADPTHKVGSDVLLDAVEEMRDAGAEAIEIDNQVRVLGSSWFGSDSRGLVVDGIAVSEPLVVEVIGDPHSLEEAVRFRGGIVSEITGPRIGGTAQIELLDKVVIDSLHSQNHSQYAQPASVQPTPR